MEKFNHLHNSDYADRELRSIRLLLDLWNADTRESKGFREILLFLLEVQIFEFFDPEFS